MASPFRKPVGAVGAFALIAASAVPRLPERLVPAPAHAAMS
jgi:hypothetical protein